MSEIVREILIGAIGSLVGALLGSLGTIVVFRGEMIGMRKDLAFTTKELGRVEAIGTKAVADANKAWVAVREMRVEVKYATQEHPKYEPRDTGEGPSVS